jgi:hypothetical protein
MSLPERINAIKTVTYDVTQIVESLQAMNDYGLQAMNDDDTYEPTLQEVFDYIEDWVFEDLDGPYGIIYQDENGEEL